jgi:hypothetical protein
MLGNNPGMGNDIPDMFGMVGIAIDFVPNFDLPILRHGGKSFGG